MIIESFTFWPIFFSALISMILGFIWYGPLFGKKWMEVIGATKDDMAARKDMQSKAVPLYFIQFFIVFFQVSILAYYIKGWPEVSPFVHSLYIWAGFIVPMIFGTAMWNNDSRKIAWTRFLLQSGYQLLLFVVFGFILGFWL